MVPTPPTSAPTTKYLFWTVLTTDGPNKPFNEALYTPPSPRHSLGTMLQPINCGIQSHVGGLLPITSGTEFEMCRQNSRGLGETGL